MGTHKATDCGPLSLLGEAFGQVSLTGSPDFKRIAPNEWEAHSEYEWDHDDTAPHGAALAVIGEPLYDECSRAAGLR